MPLPIYLPLILVTYINLLPLSSKDILHYLISDNGARPSKQFSFAVNTMLSLFFFFSNREDWKDITGEGRFSFWFPYGFCLFLLFPTMPQPEVHGWGHSADILPLAHAQSMEPLGKLTALNPVQWPPCWDPHDTDITYPKICATHTSTPLAIHSPSLRLPTPPTCLRNVGQLWPRQPYELLYHQVGYSHPFSNEVWIPALGRSHPFKFVPSLVLPISPW